jgi:hypothetical protein
VSAAVQTKTLKDQYRWSLWLAIAVNTALLGNVLQGGIALSDVPGLIGHAIVLLPVGFAYLTTTVVNGLLTSKTKARLVFLRWHHALPACRAFSRHALSDPRIDLDRLRLAVGGKLPETPVEENAAWCRLLKAVENEPKVLQSHREFLLMRDLTGVAAIALVVFGSVGVAFAPTWKVAGLYDLALAAEYLVMRQAASNYGISFVCEVMAAWSSKPSTAVRNEA